MDAGIVAAVITGVLSLIGVVVTNIAANNKMSHQIHTSQAVTDTKLDALTREVREHNNFARRVPVLEEKMESLNRRLDVLEEKIDMTRQGG